MEDSNQNQHQANITNRFDHSHRSNNLFFEIGDNQINLGDHVEDTNQSCPVISEKFSSFN